jgi:hypothetical protein
MQAVETTSTISVQHGTASEEAHAAGNAPSSRFGGLRKLPQKRSCRSCTKRPAIVSVSADLVFNSGDLTWDPMTDPVDKSAGLA